LTFLGESARSETMLNLTSLAKASKKGRFAESAGSTGFLLFMRTPHRVASSGYPVIIFIFILIRIKGPVKSSRFHAKGNRDRDGSTETVHDSAFHAKKALDFTPVQG
jgi:hypothetical protein